MEGQSIHLNKLMTPDVELTANAALTPPTTPVYSSPRSLTVGQRRLRLMTILEAEQAKRRVFEQHLQQAADSNAPESSGSDSNAIYQQLIAKQDQVITRLERRITELTDQLEGPELRQRLKQVETQLAQAAQRLEQLRRQLQASESARSQAEVEIKLLNNQLQNLHELNDNYVNQIAVLSLHERQNDEDHAHTVLAISRQLAKYGLNIPAKACIATFDYGTLNQGTPSSSAANHELSDSDTDSHDERFVADARYDQTIFSLRSRHNNQPKILSLVINSIAPDLDIAPIELKLTEFDPHTHQPVTKTLKGFATASAIAAAEAFVSVYRQLTQEPS